ncbi:SDR family oxidoreductase [Xylophilus sp. GOD-11R]|uniref:SDR family oxidoreductase n=1 Tax=Xylophilus sp. GOD-11R TaxID=3089814 RepID=UPI00298CBC90|nr:SDR family oxidoreductase [Xylophilus sp. GOD-11R]WPB58370.1 SDR family oxidoreductase [Xylophilus sp. GOD-11R]
MSSGEETTSPSATGPGAGRRVLVTGASRGIGRAAMQRLREDGWRPVGLARTVPDDIAPGEQYLAVDMTDADSLRDTLAGLLRDGPFHGLVNNAAMSPVTSLEDCSLQDMDDAIRLNLLAPLLCTQAVVPGMRAARAGRIVNISSRAGLGKVNRTAYSATKAGIVGMTRTWALELAGDGISVNAIAPGPVLTELFRAASPPGHPRTVALMDAVPLQRAAEPSELAHFIAFLLDDRSGFMTGQTLYVDGGLTVSAVKL